MDIWASSEYNLPKAVALALEILPVDLGLSFKDVRQQNWIGIGWTRWCLVSNSVTAKYRYKTIWWGRERVCRLTQPCSLSCRNAQAFFSWTECEELVFFVGFFFFFFSCWWCLFQFGIKTLTKRTCLKVKICPLSYWFPGMQQGKSANQISFVLFSHTDTGFIHQNYRTSHAQKAHVLPKGSFFIFCSLWNAIS